MTKLYLLDTDVLIDHLRGQEKARKLLQGMKQEGASLFYSVISKAEIYAGVLPEEEAAVALLFRSMIEISVDGRIAEDAGKYKKEFHQSHGLLLPDALLAASARTVGACLVTLNKRHYPMKDIAIQTPYGK